MLNGTAKIPELKSNVTAKRHLFLDLEVIYKRFSYKSWLRTRLDFAKA